MKILLKFPFGFRAILILARGSDDIGLRRPEEQIVRDLCRHIQQNRQKMIVDSTYAGPVCCFKSIPGFRHAREVLRRKDGCQPGSRR